MPLITLKEMLEDTRSRRYGVGMFNTLNLEMLRGVLSAAEEEQAPVIIALAEVHIPFGSIEMMAPIMVQAAREAKVPVAVHYDHGMTPELIVKAMKLGFTSVMYDGSTLPDEENIQQTREIVKLAKHFGVSVEAELGHVGGGEGGTEDNGYEAFYTDVEQAAGFVERTGVDALAVAIGTVHGVYRRKPELDLARLTNIARNVAVPLVLHGGSGLSDSVFRACIDRGIGKINICTDLFLAAIQALHSGLDPEFGGSPLPYPELMKTAELAMKEAAQRKITLFGSAGKA